MPRPGITVTTSAAATASTPGQRLGTWFVAAQTQRGPLVPDPRTPLRSLADLTALYGARDATLGSVATTFDMLETYWRSGGGPVLLARVVGPAATAASYTLVDRAGSPASTLAVKAKGPGAWGSSNLKVQVTNGAAASTFNLVVLVGNVVTETSPDLTSPTDAVTWSASSAYVTVSDMASATAAPGNNPAVVAATSLTSGTDDLSSVTDTHWTAALNTMPSSWGPGLVSKLGVTGASGHAGTIAHAAATNRLALLDGVSGSSQGTLTSLASTVAQAATSPEYGMLFGPWLTVPALSGGTSPRLVPPSCVAAGLISRQVTTGPANVAAAGTNGQAAWVLGVQTVFTDAERDALNGAYTVNVFRQPYSASTTPPVELYGYNTLGPASSPWRQGSAQLLRLRLVDEFTQVGEQFIFDQIDARGQKTSEFNGALAGVLQDHYNEGELYGASPAEAYTVDTTSVNTPTTVAAGQLNARVGMRVSPYAEFVWIDVAKFPVSASLAS